MERARADAPCPLYHDAVELIGRRWTGAILAVLLETGPLRFRQIAQAVPDLSDRLLAERMRAGWSSAPSSRSACNTRSRRWGAISTRRSLSCATGRSAGCADSDSRSTAAHRPIH
jgi:hypothetical protein